MYLCFCCKDTKIPATSKEIAGNFGLFSSFLFVLYNAFLQVFQHADILGVGLLSIKLPALNIEVVVYATVYALLPTAGIVCHECLSPYIPLR